MKKPEFSTGGAVKGSYHDQYLYGECNDPRTDLIVPLDRVNPIIEGKKDIFGNTIDVYLNAKYRIKQRGN